MSDNKEEIKKKKIKWKEKRELATEWRRPAKQKTRTKKAEEEWIKAQTNEWKISVNDIECLCAKR